MIFLMSISAAVLWLELTFVLLLVLFKTVFLLSYVPSESMEPTIAKESYIFGIRFWGDLKAGDIVIFEHEDSILIKRIAACPGDEITVDGVLYQVPDNGYFMLGDNVNRSYDSRYWDEPYVNRDKIIAKFVFGMKQYGKQTLTVVSKHLTNEFGKGFSVSNIQFMRRFYQTYQIQQTPSVKLSWSHYCELLSISDADKRSLYEKEAVNANWSVRELKRQIESSLFERLLLSSGDANKEKVLSLALNGNEITKPADIIRDPYVFEFLGLPEDKPLLESDLEKALVEQIEKFLLELGRGFMFVGTQQRVTIGNHHYFIS